MVDVAGLVLPFFGLILLGYIMAKLIRQGREAMGWLNVFIIYLALPALFFKLLSTTPVAELASWNFVLTNILATFTVFLSVFCIARIFRHSGTAEATIQGLGGAYGNIGYMGPGLAILAFGEAAAVPVALVFCFENVMHFTITPAMMALSGKERKTITQLIFSVARSVILHPFIIATVFGIGAAVIEFVPPVPIERLISYLAQAAAPSALFAMGVTLGVSSINKVPVELSYVIPFKLIFHPLIMYLFLSFMGDFDQLWVFTAVLLAALPTATNVFIFGQQYGFWVENSSACILVSTILSVLSVSVLLFLITNNLIPADLFPASV